MAGTKLHRQQPEGQRHQERRPMDDNIDDDEHGDDGMITEEELEVNPGVPAANDGDDERYSTVSNSLMMEEYDNFEDEEEYVGLIPTSGPSVARRVGKRKHRGVMQGATSTTSTFWNQNRWWLIVVIFVVFAFVAEFHLSSRNGHQHHDQDKIPEPDHTGGFSDFDDQQQQVLENHEKQGGSNINDDDDNASSDNMDPTEEEPSYEENDEDLVSTIDESEVPLQFPPSPYEMTIYGDGKQYNMYYRDYTYRRRGKEAFKKSLEETTSESEKTILWPMHMSCHPTSSSSSSHAQQQQQQQQREDWFRTNFTHRDVPRDEFPIDSWQRNATYVRDEFLPSSINLVQETMRLIYAEYGHEYTTSSNTTAGKMFDLLVLDKFYDFSDDPKEINKKNANVLRDGGWLTNQAYVGLKRRILHAIITQDSFIVAMGGHSAAAGHG